MENDLAQIVPKDSSVSHFHKSEIDRLIVYPNVSDFVKTHHKAFNEELLLMREFAHKENVPIILEETEMLLKSLIDIKKPKCIMEIGAAIGYSSIFFALSCPDAKVYTVEKNEGLCTEAKNQFQRLGLSDRISLIEGDARTELPKFLSSNDITFDLVFLDASKSHNKEYFDMLVPYCSDDAMILTDNVLFKGLVATPIDEIKRKNRTSVRKLQSYLEYIHGRRDVSSSVVTVGDGLAISVLKKELC